MWLAASPLSPQNASVDPTSATRLRMRDRRRDSSGERRFGALAGLRELGELG